MKKLLLSLAVTILCSIPALAQDIPRFEVFGGYSALVGNNGQGFIGAVEGNIIGSSYRVRSGSYESVGIGIVGEFGFYDVEGGNSYYFMGGPRISYGWDYARFFCHFLLGGVNFRGDDGIHNFTKFGKGFGGGLDFAINNTINIRPAQLDIISDPTDIDSDIAFRYSGGVVFTF